MVKSVLFFSFMLIFWVSIPMKEMTRIWADDGTLMVNFPSRAVMVPVSVPSIWTVAPTLGSLSSADQTRPGALDVCAMAIPMLRNRQANKNIIFNFIVSLIIKKVQLCLFSGEYFRFVRKGKESMVRGIFDRLQNYILWVKFRFGREGWLFVTGGRNFRIIRGVWL